MLPKEPLAPGPWPLLPRGVLPKELLPRGVLPKEPLALNVDGAREPAARGVREAQPAVAFAVAFAVACGVRVREVLDETLLRGVRDSRPVLPGVNGAVGVNGAPDANEQPGAPVGSRK